MTGLVSRSHRVATPAEGRFDPYSMTDADDERQSSVENRNESLASFGVGVAEEQETDAWGPLLLNRRPSRRRIEPMIIETDCNR